MKPGEQLGPAYGAVRLWRRRDIDEVDRAAPVEALHQPHLSAAERARTVEPDSELVHACDMGHLTQTSRPASSLGAQRGRYKFRSGDPGELEIRCPLSGNEGACPDGRRGREADQTTASIQFPLLARCGRAGRRGARRMRMERQLPTMSVPEAVVPLPAKSGNLERARRGDVAECAPSQPLPPTRAVAR
jgi:hypothetical protein